MAIGSKKRFDLSKVKSLLESERYLDNCPLSIEDLEAIYDDYIRGKSKFDDIKNEILSILAKNLPEVVHSIRGRVKDEYHLVEKIVRNVSNKPDKYTGIGLDNYNKIITDLIGIRIILLDKRDWKYVHNCLIKLFHSNVKYYVKDPKSAERYVENYDKYSEKATQKGEELKNSYHAEKPKVYVTSDDDYNLYMDEKLDIERSKTAYRSIHYIIRYGEVYFEIQVRTLFEEGWLEFDHRIKYPHDDNNKKKQQYIDLISSLAQTADKLIAFYDEKDFEHNDTNSLATSTKKNDSIVKESNSLDDKLFSLFL